MSTYHIVLYNPVIPQNTGSIARLCACLGATLHLIHPLGFSTDESTVKRAGLDYWDHVEVIEYLNFEEFLKKNTPENLYFFSKFSQNIYTQAKYKTPCYLVLGSETQGLPKTIHETYSQSIYKIPMRTDVVRSLNLAQAAAVVAYEAVRQNT